MLLWRLWYSGYYVWLWSGQRGFDSPLPLIFFVGNQKARYTIFIFRNCGLIYKIRFNIINMIKEMLFIGILAIGFGIYSLYNSEKLSFMSGGLEPSSCAKFGYKNGLRYQKALAIFCILLGIGAIWFSLTY